MDTRVAQQELKQRQVELQSRLASIQSDLKSSHSRDWDDQAQERENDEVLVALQRESEEQLARIDRALARIDQGTYGICTACGESIDEARLGAIPDATECINCAA